MKPWGMIGYALSIAIGASLIHMHGYYSGRSRGYAMGLVQGICEIYLKKPTDECPIKFDTWTGKITQE